MASIRQLSIICLASACWAFSFGVGTQVITHWLHAHAASDFINGLNNSTYYLGIALASLATPWLTRRFGHGCAAFGMLVSGAGLVAFPWGLGLPWWFGLRFIIGVAGAMSLIPLETIVSRDAGAGERTRDFSFYAVSLTLGGAVGMGLGLHFFEISPHLAFAIGGIVPSVAGMGLWASLRVSVLAEEHVAPRPVGWTRRFLSYGTAWCQGFLEGGMVTFLSLYLVSLGLSKDAAGILMGVTMVGVILFQVPVAWLADRFGQVPMLVTCYLFVAATLGAIPMLETTLSLCVCLFLFGAWSGAMYPLGLSLLGDDGEKAGLARSFAWYMAMECIGSQLGAAVTGEARDHWGGASMFLVELAAVLGVMLVWGVINCWQRLRFSRSECPPEFMQDRRAA